MDTVEDKRRTYRFCIDDAVLDVFGPRIGAYGIAVYTLLARHAKLKQAFPSYATITKKLGMSRRGVIYAINTLVEVGLIQKQTRTSDYGDPSSNLYTLVDLSSYHDHPTWEEGGGAPYAPPSAQDALPSAPYAPPSAQDAPGVVHHMHQGSAPYAPLLKGSLLKDAQIEGSRNPLPKVLPLASKKAPQPWQEVLDHLILVSDRPFRTPGLIPSALTHGYLVADLLLVIDWWAAVKTVEDPGQSKYFDNDTPFRPTKIDKYHAAAVVWDREGRPAALRPGVIHPRSAQAVQALVKEVQDDGGPRLPALFNRHQSSRGGLRRLGN